MLCTLQVFLLALCTGCRESHRKWTVPVWLEPCGHRVSGGVHSVFRGEGTCSVASSHEKRTPVGGVYIFGSSPDGGPWANSLSPSKHTNVNNSVIWNREHLCAWPGYCLFDTPTSSHLSPLPLCLLYPKGAPRKTVEFTRGRTDMRKSEVLPPGFYPLTWSPFSETR